MKKHRVDGLLISISKNTNNYEHFEALQRYNIPIVYFDRIPKIPNIHYVACNMINGTVQAINFLFKKGHRVIFVIGNHDLELHYQKVQDSILEGLGLNADERKGKTGN